MSPCWISFLNIMVKWFQDIARLFCQMFLAEYPVSHKASSLINLLSHQRCSIKKGVFKDFARFTGKRLCRSLFFNKVAGLRHLTHLDDCFFCSEQMWLVRNGCIMKYYYFVNEFEQINQLLFFLKSSDNYRFSLDFRGNRN